MKNRKIIFSIGTLGVFLAPIITVISCGSDNARYVDSAIVNQLVTSRLEKQKNLYEKLNEKADKITDQNSVLWLNRHKITTIEGSVKTAQLNDDIIKFEMEISYLQEGVKYKRVEKADGKIYDKTYQDGTTIKVMDVTTYQTNNRVNNAPEKIRTTTDAVPISELFGKDAAKLAFVSSTDIKEDNIVRNITIYHTNDTHGRMKTDSGKYNKYIGMSGLASLMDSQPHDLLLSGGDYMQGTGVSNFDHGQRAMQIANMVGYDAIASGNHEYDWGYKLLMAYGMNTPVYSNNTIVKSNGKGISSKKELDELTKKGGALSNVDTSMLPNFSKEVDGSKLILPGVRSKLLKGQLTAGIITLTTPDIATKVKPDNVADVTATDDMSPIVQAEINRYKEAGVNLVIIASHVGNDPSSVQTTKDLISKVEGIDLVVDGHSHELYDVNETTKDKNGGEVHIAQTGAYTQNIGKITFDFNKTTGKIQNFRQDYIDFEEFKAMNLKKVDKVEYVINRAAAAYDLYSKEAAFNLPVGISDSLILEGTKDNAPTRTVRTFESSSGNFTADGLLYSYKVNQPNGSNKFDVNTSIGFTNGGGVRTSIAKGDTTFGDWIDMSPFNNTVVAVNATGKQLYAMFNHAAKNVGGGSFAQVSQNVEIVYEAYAADIEGLAILTKESLAKNKVKSLKINGKEVKNDDSETYQVVGNDFLRLGGDGYKETWTSLSEIYNGGTISDQLIKYGKFLVENSKKSDTIQNKIFNWNNYKTYITPKLEGGSIGTSRRIIWDADDNMKKIIKKYQNIV